MKRLHRLLIGSMMLVLTAVLLAGCASTAEYEALQTDHASLMQENTSLKGENSGLKGELEAAQSDLTNAQAEYDALQSDLTKVQADYEAANKELTEIKEIYPARDFSSLSELQDWLLKNDVSDRPDTTAAESWYSKALEIQEDALRDGYIISVDYDYDEIEDGYWVWCITIINGDIWYWDPETDEPFQEYDLGKVK